MNILIACEFSGVVREAFRKKGHKAYSCDILEAADDSLFHIQDDVTKILGGFDGLTWDMIIGHPPCTYLANSGVRHLHAKSANKNSTKPSGQARMKEMVKAVNYLIKSRIPLLRKSV